MHLLQDRGDAYRIVLGPVGVVLKLDLILVQEIEDKYKASLEDVYIYIYTPEGSISKAQPE